MRRIAIVFALTALVPEMPVAAGQMPVPEILIEQAGQRPGARRLPPRDRQDTEPAGTALIRGRVVAADTGAPLRRVQVRAAAPEIRQGRIATTDPEGRYELKDLPAGRYSLTASKGGFVTVQFGQRRAFESGRPLELADGQILEKVDFLLPRGSVLAGRIVDEYGEPVAEAFVQALRYRYIGGRRQLAAAGRPDQTNDIGEFRLFGLPPGDYFVAATLRSGPAMGGDPTTTTGYPATYYPGTPSVGEAQPVMVALGQELAGLGFALVPARTARITGIVTDSTGAPLADGMVGIMQEQIIEDGGMMFFGAQGGRIRGDGSFAIAGVAPGDYMLRVNPGGPFGQGDGEFAIVPLTVAGEDISGLVIRTTLGATLKGVVVFEGGAPGDSRGTRLRVMAASAEPGMMAGPGRAGGMGNVREDGSFEITGLWGKRMIRLAEPPPGWFLKEILLDDVDVTDTPIEFQGSETVTGLRAVLTNQTTSVAGTVRDERGQPVSDYVAVVFSEDSARWGFQSRSVRSSRPDQTGTFRVDGLPPGDYLAIAAAAIEEGAWSDPEFLEQLRSFATRLSVGAGESKALTLKLAVLP